ncbi:pyruvate formate lyase family protein [Desulfatibacillum aliphaticivorans]|uniref:pyruvate formate lyase family protein n=1 Tax=Desulfatibacillum aliphaticivorans TaxID=218208 RepID=UPI00041A6B0E|nr:pyruvate formate lyase family protein [Desulfatibacillum aliphaticivorans]
MVKAVKTELGVASFRMSLKMLALLFRISPAFRKEIVNKDTGFVFNARYQFSTRDDKVHIFLIINEGNVRTGPGKISNPDVIIYYKDKETLARIFSKSPEESLDYLLSNEMSYTGNMSYLTRFSYITTLANNLLSKKKASEESKLFARIQDIDQGEKRRKLQNETLDKKVDAVEFLEDPYLGRLTLEDFPRLKYLKNKRFSTKPAVCSERARLLTEFHRKKGFETDQSGAPWHPGLRQALAMKHVMSCKKPIITDKQLIAGSTTAKEVGVPVYPELIGTTIWPELTTIMDRELNPNDLSEEEARILNFEVFPYWMDRNVREHCRREFGNPVSQQLEERFVLYFMMKNNAISHTIPDFRKVVEEGLESVGKEARKREQEATDQDQILFYRSLYAAVEGVLAYAENLKYEAVDQIAAMDPEDPEEAVRIAELKKIAQVCERVPAKPARTVYEGLMAIWISFVCLHVENANSALSIGRLDQILQPLLVKEMARVKTDKGREEVVKRTIELVGSFFLKLNDHDPLMPSVGNKLFGGSSSDDTVTVGGVTREGENAVNDMSYIILKTAEMLCFQDPNLNARYYEGINSPEYLRRLAEVNINMVASPSIHNDKAMIDALVHQDIPIEDARDWGVTGCVEPTIVGRHYGHTNCMLVNMVAALEMALNNGVHPVMGDLIGPRTGEAAADFTTYEDFLAAYKTQLKYLCDMSVEINNYLGKSHQYIHPTPVLSAMSTGPMENGKDLIDGGAMYNTSGVAMVSLTDVVDSLMVIKKLIYEQKALDFPALLDALARDFEGDANVVHARVNRIPKFGSGDEEAISIAQDLIDFCYDVYIPQKNYRGGAYWPGFWSISYHVGFGMLSGALPSGRKRGKAFTPGLTPAPGSAEQVLPNIRSVAALNHLKMPNNIAFNVKLAPHAGDSHSKTLDYFSSYLQSYFELGGMQWQFNVLTTDMLKDAMDHPEDYRWLIVRISGYNAYFVKLNRNMQEELIERTEFLS